MSFNRFAFSFIFVTVLLSSSSPEPLSALVAMAAYVGVALLIALHLWMRPTVTPCRRLAAVLIDTAILSWQLHAGGGITSMFFPIYLWIAFGNGFRFGFIWLRVAMLATSGGFAVVVATTPFWLAHLHLAIGLLVGLVALPLYADTLIQRLSQARQEAEQANAAKTLFFASVSHELRTPLTAILGMGGMLRDTRLDSEQADMARTIGVAATTLLALIDGILDLSRMEARRMPAAPIEFELSMFLDEVLSLVAFQARTKNIALTLHVTPRTPINVVGSRNHLSEILVNLLGNAVKFTTSGGVLLAIDAEPTATGRRRLKVEVIDTGIGIAPQAQERIFDAFTQADPTIQGTYGGTGLGLANAKRRAELLGGDITVKSSPGVGTCFTVSLEFDVAKDTTGQSDGSGGIVAVFAADAGVRSEWQARLAALGVVADRPDPVIGSPRKDGRSCPLLLVHDGAPASLEDVSTLLRAAGAGAGQQVIFVGDLSEAAIEPVRWVVTTVLSARADQATLAQALAIVRAGRPDDLPPSGVTTSLARAASGRRILLADDNRTNQRVFAKVLERAGHEVVVVSDGDAALDRLSDEQAEFDLVLMDVNMPGLDGVEATQLYRAMAMGEPQPPVVALTADATAEMAKRCRDAGMDACVTKPIQPAQLVDLVARMTQRPGSTPMPATAEDETSSDDGSGNELLDLRQVETLLKLGGKSFVAELTEAFLDEADIIVGQLTTAAIGGDLSTFRNCVHALRSSSGNVGATRLNDLSASWQNLGLGELRSLGLQIAIRARNELERTRTALQALPSAGQPRGFMQGSIIDGKEDKIQGRRPPRSSGLSRCRTDASDGLLRAGDPAR